MFTLLFALFAVITANSNATDQCITFSVGTGTGCQWMCDYCGNQLGTNNYYFTTDVCKYEAIAVVDIPQVHVLRGCVGNPSPGVSYTCCSV
jgi:hypothetical protein